MPLLDPFHRGEKAQRSILLKVTQLEVTHQDNFSALKVINAITFHVIKYI